MITLTRSGSYFFINGDLSPELVESIQNVTSYYVQNYERTDKFQNGLWDGKENLLRRAKNGNYYFPFGLIDNVKSALSIWGVQCQVRDERVGKFTEEIKGGDTLLRPYQIKALNKLRLNCYNSSGVIALPTAAGKTFCALHWAKHLNLPFMVLVHRVELLRQWRDEIQKFFGYSPIVIGAGEDSDGDAHATVAMIQTLSKRTEKYDTGLLVIDECFTYDTIIKTDKGNLKIGDIVESKIACNVLTHTGEYKPILNRFKKPFCGMLVRCVYDYGFFECTENHKILTNRGWVEAINLSCRDYIYYNDDLQMQDMREGIRESICSWWSCKCDALASRIVVQKYISKIILGWNVKRRKNCSYDEDSSVSAFVASQNRIVSIPETTDIGEFDGGYVNKLPKFSQQCPEMHNSAFFKAIPIRRLEIFSTKRSLWKSPKARDKWGVWNNELCIYNSISSMLKRGIRYCKSGWENRVHGGMVISNYRSYSNNNVVFGRRIDESRRVWRKYKNIIGENYKIGGGYIKELVIGGMGYLFNSKSSKERIYRWDIYQRTCKKVFGYFKEFKFYSSHDAIQNSVYDIEVADNHTYTANGIIVHNCHTCPAKTFYDVSMRINARYRLGLSATPTRSDGAEMKIFAACGTIADVVSVEDLVRDGYLARPVFRLERIPPVRVPYSASWAKVYKQGITTNMDRNERIATIAEEYLSNGRQLYIHVNHIDHGKCITGMITGAVFVSGSSKKDEREDIIKRFKDGEIICLVSTLLREGVSIDGISCLILGSAGKSFTSVIQTIGRALRVDPVFGDAVIVDFLDCGHRILESHVQDRISAYRETYGELFQY